MRKSITTRFIAAAGAVALGVLGAVTLSTSASAVDGPNIDPATQGTITIHKHAQPTPVGDPASGVDQGILPDPLAGVVFTVTPVNGIDLTANEGWEAAAELVADPAVLDLGATIELSPTNAEGIAVSPSLRLGVYLVQEIATGGNDVVVQSAPFLVTVPLPTVGETPGWNYGIHVYPKNAVLDAPTKALDESTAFAQGNTVTWTVTAKVPAFEVASDLTSFVIADDLDERLAYVPSAGVRLTNAAGEVVALAPGDYEVSTINPVTVEFTPAGRAKLAATPNGTVTVVIDTVVEDAGAIVNTATVAVNETELPTNPETTNWVPVQVTKVDAATPAKALAGAQFQVYTTAEGGDPLSFLIDGEQFTTFTTNASGQLTIPGLKAGVAYWLEETVAPNGYFDLEERVRISESLPAASAGDGVLETFVLQVTNEQIPEWELPLTGGNGTLWFAVGGVALVAVAIGAALIVARRNRVNA